MTEKEEKELDEKIDKMAKTALETEKEIREWEPSEEEWELDKSEVEMMTPICHIIKPEGVMGKEFMVENALLRHCVGCGDEEQCWNVGQLKDLIKEESKTLLNQDF